MKPTIPVTPPIAYIGREIIEFVSNFLPNNKNIPVKTHKVISNSIKGSAIHPLIIQFYLNLALSEAENRGDANS